MRQKVSKTKAQVLKTAKTISNISSSSCDSSSSLASENKQNETMSRKSMSPEASKHQVQLKEIKTSNNFENRL